MKKGAKWRAKKAEKSLKKYLYKKIRKKGRKAQYRYKCVMEGFLSLISR